MDNNVVAKHILDVAVGLEKKSKAELITELSDIFDNASKIDLNSKENIQSLKNLAKAFETIFTKAGNKSINFADLIEMPPPAMFAEMGKIAATSFWDAWNSVSGSVSDNLTANLEESLKQLKLEQADLKRERTRIQSEINKKVANKEKADSLIDFDDKTVKSLKVEGDVIQKAKEMYSNLRNTAKQLSDIGKEQGQDSQEYIKALYEAQEIYHDMYRMRKTLQKTEVKVPENIRAAYGLLEYDDSDGFHITEDRMAYEEKAYKAGKNPLIPFYETNAGEFIGDRWERFAGTINKSQKELDAVESRLSEIDAQVSEITKSIQATGGAAEVVVKNENNGLKTLNEIEEAYKRIRVESEKRVDDRQVKHIMSALEFDPDKSSEGIKSLYDQYQKAAESGNWVEEYRALLKYVRLYESYLTTTNKTHSNKITKKNNPFTPLYEQLKPMADNAQNMLQNILNMGEGKPLVGLGGTGSGGDGGGPTPEDVANAQRVKEETEAKLRVEKEAREEIEKRLAAEKEIEESLKKQRAEEERLAKAAEKKRLAEEANLKATEEAVASRKEELGLMQAMDKFQDEFEKTDKKNETLAFINSKTGNMSELFVGDPHSVTMDPGTSRKMAGLGYDTEVHSHSWKTAAPSVADFEEWFKQFGYIKKFGIRAGEELLAFDFSQLDPSQLLGVIDKYKELDERVSNQFKETSFDGKVALSLEHGGINEALQVFMRRGLEDIVKNSFPDIMSSMKMPDLPIDRIQPQAKSSSFIDTWAKASEEVRALIKELAILEHQIDEIADKGGDAGNLIDRSNTISDSLPKDIVGGLNDRDWEAYVKSVAAEAVGAEQAVDGLNESLEKTQQLTSGDGTGSGTGDASSSELEAERAKSEALQDELDHRIGALQAAHDEKEMLQSDLNIVNEQIKIAQDSEMAARARADETDLKLIEKEKHIQALEEQLSQAQISDGDALFAAEQRAKEAEDRAYMYDRAMTSMQEEMADLRGQLANTKTGGGEGYSSVSSEELKNVLNSIVYNVKIAHDDSDKTSNKIALDDSTLEATLTKVFANILNPQTQQNDSEQKQAPWALENTLQTVKGVLDNIHTNTSKIGTIAPSNVDAIAGTALDGRLAEIKSVLESIDNKIAKGGVIATRGAVKQANAQPIESEAKAQAARSNMMKSLINDYKTLGKLSAKFASDGDLETKARLDNLKEEIARKRKSLKLSMDESASLREKYSMAFDAEKRLLDAEKAQKEINAQIKADAKEAEAAWKKQVKDAQRATGINAATTAANAGDQTVVRAIGTEGISKDIESKAKELAERIKDLRVLRDEIDKKGEQASAQDRDILSKQIVKVKELKTELDGYLKIHDKYSGKGVTWFDNIDTSNFGAVGTDQYWHNITAAVKSLSSGRSTVKGMNTDTGELNGTTKIAANTFAEWSAVVHPITGKLGILRTGIKKTETIIEQITRKTKEIFTYFSGSSIIFKAFNELKKGVQYVRDIDLALTELKKVTDATEETYDRFLKTAAKTADKVGSTIKDVVSSTADWARLGYSIKEAAELAESTQILMNVSEFTDINQATDALISSIQAFKYTAEESMDVVNILNTIGNNYAISTADLAQSLTKSSASLVAANGTLEEAVALTATANAIVQDADSVGTALKTTSLRLRGTSVTELEKEGLDADGAVESTSKLQSKVKALSGVDILTATGEYKSTYEILSQIADVWSEMNDMDQAALLELIAGKRNSSVVAAILQAPEALKAAYADAQDAEGSALRENQKYLDSIQGRIDQFNNAMQAMWSNTLDSDMVKDIVSLGTELIKLIDKVGLLNSALIALATISMVKNKMGPIEFLSGISDGIKGAASKVIGFIGSLTGATAATSAYTSETLAASVANGTLSASEAASIASKNGLTLATTNLTAAEAAEMLVKAGVTKADALAIVAKLGLTSSTQALSLADIEAAVSSGTLTAAQGAQISSALGLTAANTGLTASLTALWTALWPILAVMAGVAVIYGVVKGIDALITTTEEHTEKLNDMKSELADTQSELDSVNSELKTTKERMAELIAMPSLSFTEQEELNRLKEQNEELERRERLLKAQKEREKKRIAEQAVETVKSQLADTSYNAEWYDMIPNALLNAAGGALAGFMVAGPVGAIVMGLAGAATGAQVAWGSHQISTEDKVDQEIEEYKRLASEKERLEKELETASDEDTSLFGWGKSDYEKTKEELEKVEKELGETETYIDGVIKEMGANLDGVEYGYGADEILSFYDNLQYEFEIARGTIGAESDAIANIFNRPEYESTYNEIKRLQGELEKDPGNKTYLAQISELCKKAEEDLIAVGLSADKAFNYFTMKSGSSVDDIMAQYKVAKTALEDLKSGAVSIDDLVKYDEEKGEATGRPDAIAEKLQGVSPEVRKQFTSIVEAIKEGSYDTEDGLTNWDAAIKKMELQGMQAVIANVKTELEAANKLAFPDLEISGWIDSVEELKGAFESLSSAMDLIVTAQEQMNSSGRISMKTALDLMATTDDWNQILEVNNGVITMNANAEQILIQSKLDLIKANIEMALQQVETDIALMEGAINSTKAGNAFTQGFTKALTNAQGVLVGLKAGWDAFWAGEDVASAFNGAYKSTVDNLTPDESSLGDLYTQRANLLKQKEMLTGVDTTQEFKNNYDFNKKPGDKYGDSEDDAFQREMDYWENRIAANQAKRDQIQNEIDLLEAKGMRAGEEYYSELIALEEERIALLEAQRNEALAYLSTQEEGSEEWWSAAKIVNDLEGEIDDATASIQDFADAQAQIKWDNLEEITSRFSDLHDEISDLRDILQREDMFDEDGNWTESGAAVLGTYVHDLEVYKNELAMLQSEIADLQAHPYNEANAAYLKETYSIDSEQEYNDLVTKWNQTQRDLVKGAYDTADAIKDAYSQQVDAIEDAINDQIDAYNDYIDVVKSALDAERD